MMTMNELDEVISKCLLQKLSKNVEQSENHVEYKLREDMLASQFNTILKYINDESESEIAPDMLSQLLILDLELQSIGPWFCELSKECSEKLNNLFENLYTFKLSTVLQHLDVDDAQLVFDICFEDLHTKLTLEDFKKYPALHDVYCSIVQHIPEYNVVINPMKIMPICLLLIDDYIVNNKLKGLKSCLIILKCLTAQNFQGGNYYEVIYGSLNKITLDKEIDVTKLTLECLLQLMKILPPEIKVKKLDDIFKRGLDQINTEANLYRKAAWFNFTTNLIEMQGVNCVDQKILKSILCDNIDMCCNEAVGEILLSDVLECLETWIKYCWCIWRFSSDQKILSTLLKLLYVSSGDEQKASKIRIVIITLVCLCTKEEQRIIYKNIEDATQQINKPEFVSSLEIIKNSVCI
ncbi:uncharacterized protein LOC131850537 [Achroia grisella]|uniref:uncharacterized protein LOC131850537 n=1 Tax=Achroia grisella TaxID=688607 RepID=UPI0027D2E745|nr:uncharacterized protein LOC131850537 [Achroia grisella]